MGEDAADGEEGTSVWRHGVCNVRSTGFLPWEKKLSTYQRHSDHFDKFSRKRNPIFTLRWSLVRAVVETTDIAKCDNRPDRLAASTPSNERLDACRLGRKNQFCSGDSFNFAVKATCCVQFRTQRQQRLARPMEP